MTKTQLVCDSCGKPIDNQNCIQFLPIRGGLNVGVTENGVLATALINSQVCLCNANCVNAWLADIKPAKS